MLRVALDTENLELLRPLAPVMLTYADLVPSPDQIKARIAPSVLVLIDRKLGDPSGQASVCDIEPGSWRPDEFAGWYDERANKGIKFLTAYADRSEMPAVDDAAGKRGFWRWLATLDGTLHAPGYAPLHSPALVQAINAQMIGENFDMSIIMEPQWHPTPDLSHFPVLAEIARRALAATTSAGTDLGRIIATLESR